MSHNSLVHTEEYKGYKIEIFPDQDAGNPFQEWDQAGKAICWHRNYNLGTKHDFKTPRDFVESLVDAKDLTPEQDENWDEISDTDLFELAQKDNLIFPLYLYDHSGISMRMGSNGNPFMGRAQHAEWDSGQVGWMYISHADIQKEWGDPALPENLDKAEKCLKSEIETYDDYLTGNVYGYVVSKNIASDDADEPEWEEVDSCWGYYGYYHDKDAHIISEAKSVADHHEEKSLPLLAVGGLLRDDKQANI